MNYEYIRPWTALVHANPCESIIPAEKTVIEEIIIAATGAICRNPRDI